MSCCASKAFIRTLAATSILHGVDLTVRRERVTMLLGRNGAGKTTTLRTIMGLWKARKGRIEFDGQSLLTWPPRTSRGWASPTFPKAWAFSANLTVRENLLLATGPQGFAQERLDQVLERFPALKLKWDSAAGLLSGGQKQMLAISRGHHRKAPAVDRGRADQRACRRRWWTSSSSPCWRSRQSKRRCCWWNRISAWRAPWATTSP